jgi:hypothetical protein
MHRKTTQLWDALGDCAYWIPPRLWAYAAEHQPDGIFEKYSPRQIAKALEYPGDASEMLQALLDASFMDSNPLRIHDWAEHNEYHRTFAERAKKAAAARWAKPSVPSKPSPGKDKDIERGASIASSNACSISPPLSDVDKINIGDELKHVRKQLAGFGKLNEYDPSSKSFKKLNELRELEADYVKKLGLK